MRRLLLVSIFFCLASFASGQSFDWVGTTTKSAFANKSYKITGTLTLSDGFNIKAADDGDFFARAVQPDKPTSTSIGYRGFTVAWVNDTEDATGTTYEVNVFDENNASVIGGWQVPGTANTYSYVDGSGCDSEDYDIAVRVQYNGVWIESTKLEVSTNAAIMPDYSEVSQGWYYWPFSTIGNANPTYTTVDWFIANNVYSYGIDYVDLEVVDAKNSESFGTERLQLVKQTGSTNQVYTKTGLEANRQYKVSMNKACNIDVPSLNYPNNPGSKWTRFNAPITVSSSNITYGPSLKDTLHIYYDWKDYYGDPITHIDGGDMIIKHLNFPTQGLDNVSASNETDQYVFSVDFDFVENTTYSFRLAADSYTFQDDFSVTAPASGSRTRKELNRNEKLNQYQGFSLFPNPFSSRLSVNLGDKMMIDQLSIRDLSGRTISEVLEVSSDQREVSLELNGLEQGVYLLVGYRENQKVFSEKIIKE